MPDWNKEISFRRKKPAAPSPAPAPAAAKVPFWKKEISLGRKPKAPAGPKPASTPFWKKEIGGRKKAAAAPVEQKVPFWKKEIGGRKKAAAAPVEQKVPFWKKEIGGRKKAAAAPVEQKVPFWKKEIGGRKKAAAAPVEQKVPFWKKEIGGRKKAAAAPVEQKVPFWKKEIGGRKRDAPVVEAVAPASAPAPAAPPPAAEFEPEPPEDYSWLTDKLDAYAPPPVPEAAPPAPEPAAGGAWPPPSDEPVVVAAWPPPSGETPAAAWPPPVPAAPTQPPAPAAPAPAPVPQPAPVAQVPEPAAPAPAAAAAEPPPAEKVPFWKKELSLGKKKPLPPVPLTLPDPAEKLPLWKRDLSFGGGKAPKAPKEPKLKGEPFWKKELSLGGGRGEKAPKAEKVKGEPFWKRDLSFGGGRGEKAPKAEKVKGEPFWKRDLSLGGGAKAPRAPRGKPAATGAQKKENATFVGLKIGASQLAAARIHNNGDPQLLQVAREELDDGVVVGGELRDVEALADALKRFFAKHKLPKKGVRLGIANNRIGVRTFEIGGIEDPKQLANAIRFRAQETLPIPLEEAVLDWQVLREETSDEGVTTRRVLLVVAYRELVDRYVLACKKAGIRLEGIDLEAFAVLRALAPPAAEGLLPVGAQVVVNVGHDRSTFAVTDGRVCEFTRVLAWGGQNLNVAIARALDMTPSEAAPIKHALSLVDSSVAMEDISAETVQAVCEAVRTELQAFARELVSSLRFYQNQPGSLGIAELLLTGGTAELPGLAAELESLTSVVVRVGDPFVRLKVGKRVRGPEQHGSLAVAIGLGIED